jgi:hypothetical protein
MALRLGSGVLRLSGHCGRSARGLLMPGDAEQLFEELRAEHGGDQLTATQLSIIRSLANVLTSDAPSPRAIEVLSGLLPGKAAAVNAYDLTKLSDQQLDQLNHLTSIATGEPPELTQPPELTDAD